MANIIEGLFHTIQAPISPLKLIHQGILQSILAVIQAFFNVVYSVFHGIFSLVWGVVESLASFVGASAHFVASNILILGILAVAFVIYRDRNTRGTVGNNLKKKTQ